MSNQARQRSQARNARAENVSVREADHTREEAAALRRALLWSAAGFLAVAILGLLLVPGMRFLWIVLLVCGIAAVPAAFQRDS